MPIPRQSFFNMSSKSKKGGKSERTPVTRQSSNKGNKQGQSSKPQSSKLQDSATFENYNKYVADSVVRLVGCPVQLRTIDGNIYDGVLETISPKYDICLRSAHLAHGTHNRQDHLNNPTKEDIEDIKFEFRYVDSIKCKNVDWNFPEKDSFHTDSKISSSNGPISTERELKPWQSDKDDIPLGKLEEITDIRNGGDSFSELKRANEEKFNYKSTYTNDSLDQYMDGIEKDDQDLYQRRSEQAEKVAQEIVQEEAFKKHDRLDSGISEEDQFSSVKRPGFNSSSARNSAMQIRNRGGRSRNPNYHMSTVDAQNDDRSRRPVNFKRPEPDKVLYSECVKAQTQADISQNVRNSIIQQQQQPYTQQQQHMSHQQTATQEPLNQTAENKLPPATIQPMNHHKTTGGYSFHGQGSSYQENIPPRMQQQQQQHHFGGNIPVQSAQKPHIPPQRDIGAVLPPKSDNPPYGERKLDNRDTGMHIASQIGNPSDKPARFTRVQSKLPPSNEIAPKSSRELHKYGKTHQQPDSSQEVNVKKLQLFGERFSLPPEKSKQPEDGHAQEKAKPNGDVAQTTSRLPLKTEPGDSKAPELASDVQDLKLNETKLNEKFHMKTNTVDASKEDLPHVTGKELKTDSIPRPKMTKNPRDIPAASVKDAAVAEEEGVVIQLSPEPKSTEKNPSEKALTKLTEEKVPSETKELAPAAEQKPSSFSKTKLNPNAGEFVPRASVPSSPASSTSHYHGGGATQQPAPTSSFQSNTPVSQAPTYQPRFRAFQPNYTASDSSPQVYQGGYMPQQGIQSQPQSHQQVVQYIILPNNSNFSNQPQFVRAVQPQSFPPQMVTPLYQDPQNLYVSVPAGTPMLHQQQQGMHPLQSHSSTPSQQQPMHFMMQPQASQYSQIGSPMQSNPQGPPGPHARPPTPSQHTIHPSATPPLHPVGGQQPMFYPPGPVQNVPSQTFVATQRGQHMPPFQ